MITSFFGTPLNDTPGTIHHAIYNKLGLEKVKELLEKDPNLLNQKDPKMYNYTPLHEACYGNDSRDPIALFLIEQGADVNDVTDGGWTPLMNACHYKRRVLVKRLIEAGADINHKRNNGETAFTVNYGEFTPILQQIISEIATERKEKEKQDKEKQDKEREEKEKQEKEREEKEKQEKEREEKEKQEKERIRIENLLGNRFLQIEAQLQARKQENEELKAENTKLRHELENVRAELQEENNRLKETIDDQNKLIKDLQEGNAKLKNEVENVNEVITLLKQTNGDHIKLINFLQEENVHLKKDLEKEKADRMKEVLQLKEVIEDQVKLELKKEKEERKRENEQIQKLLLEKDSEISSILGQLRAHENELRIYIEARLPDVLPNVYICHSPENQIASSSPILSSNTRQPSDIPQQSLKEEEKKEDNVIGLDVSSIKVSMMEKDTNLDTTSVEQQTQESNASSLLPAEELTSPLDNSSISASPASYFYDHLTLIQCVTLLKNLLGITSEISSPQMIIDAAVELLSADDEVRQYQSLLLKARYLVKQVMG